MIPSTSGQKTNATAPQMIAAMLKAEPPVPVPVRTG